jgi:hypothetical protein
MNIRFPVIFGLAIFVLMNAYSAWFWRSPRKIELWVVFFLTQSAAVVSWWWLLRKGHMTLTKLTTVYDAIAIGLWYLPLLIWREQDVTVMQLVGLLLMLVAVCLVSF